MNNSKFTIDSVSLNEEEKVDISPLYRQREAELEKIIEAFDAINSSSYWKTLQKLIFEGIHESIQKKLYKEKDEKEIFRLQGQIVWAEKFLDFNKLSALYRNELLNIRKNLNK